MLNQNYNFSSDVLPGGDDVQESSYDINDYIDLEKADFSFESDRVNVEKVVFKNLDVSIVNEFYDEQNRFIDLAEDSYNYYASINFEGISSENGIIAYSDIWYQINGDILSVYYAFHFEEEIGDCVAIAVVNIDLKNNKLVSNEELLKLAGTNFEDIALNHYNNTLKNVKECEASECRVQDKDYNLITVDQFESNKDSYIKMITDGLEEVINCYIEDGVIKYDYSRYGIDTLYLGVGKGGCFDYITVEVGNYK